MKILAVNPNTSKSFSERIYVTMQKYAASGTQFEVVNPASGPRSIESIYDAILSAPGTLEVVISLKDQYDAFLMACYADHPVITAVREITEKPVLGIAEASMHMACMLGHRFSIITSTESWVPLLMDAVQHFGLSGRCASIRAIGLPVLGCDTLGLEAYTNAMLACAQLAVEQDGAEVICLGGAGMTGLDKPLESQLGVPVLDGVVCALKILEGMSLYGVSTSKRRAYGVPHKKDLLNLPAVFDLPYVS